MDEKPEIILFQNSSGTTRRRAIGNDWRALIGANGTCPVDDNELAEFEKSFRIVRIIISDAEMEQLQTKAPEQGIPGDQFTNL